MQTIVNNIRSLLVGQSDSTTVNNTVPSVPTTTPTTTISATLTMNKLPRTEKKDVVVEQELSTTEPASNVPSLTRMACSKVLYCILAQNMRTKFMKTLASAEVISHGDLEYRFGYMNVDYSVASKEFFQHLFMTVPIPKNIFKVVFNKDVFRSCTRFFLGPSYPDGRTYAYKWITDTVEGKENIYVADFEKQLEVAYMDCSYCHDPFCTATGCAFVCRKLSKDYVIPLFGEDEKVPYESIKSLFDSRRVPQTLIIYPCYLYVYRYKHWIVDEKADNLIISEAYGYVIDSAIICKTCIDLYLNGSINEQGQLVPLPLSVKKDV